MQANFSNTMQESRDFVINDYSLALFKGDLFDPEEKKRIVEQIARFTGLSPQYIERSNLRIEDAAFCQRASCAIKSEQLGVSTADLKESIPKLWAKRSNMIPVRRPFLGPLPPPSIIMYDGPQMAKDDAL